MEGSRLPIKTWFIAQFLFGRNNGIDSYSLAFELGVTQKTSWYILQRIRGKVAEKRPECLSYKVEVDERNEGGKDAKRHSHQKARLKSTVFGGKERETGNVWSFYIPDRSEETLTAAVEKIVKAGSTLYTDGLKSYQKLGVSYLIESTNHSNGVYVLKGENHTQGIESYWNTQKRTMRATYIAVSQKHLNLYLAEMDYRFNYAKRIGTYQMLDMVLGDGNGKPFTFKKLTARKNEYKYKEGADPDIVENRTEFMKRKDNWVDLAGKIRRNDAGVEVFAFGRYFSQPVKSRPDYIDKLLEMNFPEDTKVHLRRLISNDSQNMLHRKTRKL
jgi:transposase-like protein